MKILLRILMGIAALIILLLIIALFLPKESKYEREIVINKPQQQVYDYIKMLNNQPNYNSFLRADPSAKTETRGTDGTVGGGYYWKGKECGEGEMEITKLTEGERVDMSIHFIEPFDSKGEVYYTSEKVSDSQTKVKWGMTANSPYPLNLMSALMGGHMKTELDKSLALMKADVEK